MNFQLPERINNKIILRIATDDYILAETITEQQPPHSKQIKSACMRVYKYQSSIKRIRFKVYTSQGHYQGYNGICSTHIQCNNYHKYKKGINN